jgi:hypothetical protein
MSLLLEIRPKTSFFAPTADRVKIGSIEPFF